MAQRPAEGRTLAIECATQACSVALFEGGTLLANEHRVLGRGHAEHLIPMIAGLPDKGQADHILVSRGPGSFTGVRIGLASARALALAWGSTLAGYPTLALVAAQLWGKGPSATTVCMEGGHGEWFVQNFGVEGMPEGPACSMTPEAASAACKHPLIAGNRAPDLAALVPDSEHKAHDILPDARHALRLPAHLITDEIQPIYGRAPDAKPAAP